MRIKYNDALLSLGGFDRGCSVSTTIEKTFDNTEDTKYPKEIEEIRFDKDYHKKLLKMYLDLRRDYVDILKENDIIKRKNEKLEKENSDMSHELWIKNGCGYMGGS